MIADTWTLLHSLTWRPAEVSPSKQTAMRHVLPGHLLLLYCSLKSDRGFKSEKQSVHPVFLRRRGPFSCGSGQSLRASTGPGLCRLKNGSMSLGVAGRTGDSSSRQDAPASAGLQDSSSGEPLAAALIKFKEVQHNSVLKMSQSTTPGLLKAC